YIAPLQPPTLASVKTWGNSEGAGRAGLPYICGRPNNSPNGVQDFPIFALCFSKAGAKVAQIFEIRKKTSVFLLFFVLSGEN
ncbi:MAG: hypothetical protein KBS77_04745, partial [Bacteroidales bacterium]|nr:hypothetical protein [Candidatus Colicola faecequi]